MAAAVILTTQTDVCCPYCNETIALILDLSVPAQEYIEDCSVCCQPMLVRYACEGDQLLGLSVEQS